MTHARLRTALALAVAALLLLAVGSASAATTSCGDFSFKLAGATIKVAKVTANGVTCQKAKSLSRKCISATGPSSAWTATQSGRKVTLTNGAKKVTFRTVNATQTCVGSG